MNSTDNNKGVANSFEVSAPKMSAADFLESCEEPLANTLSEPKAFLILLALAACLPVAVILHNISAPKIYVIENTLCCKNKVFKSKDIQYLIRSKDMWGETIKIYSKGKVIARITPVHKNADKLVNWAEQNGITVYEG